MHRPTQLRFVALALIGSALGACTGGESAAPTTAVAFQGARLIDGTGSAVVKDAVLVVDNGQFTAVGASGDVDVPEGAAVVDLSGHTVMPALVNAHFHLATDRAERVDQLHHAAYYGTGLTVSLGHDDGDMPLALRDETIEGAARSMSAGRGITRPEEGRSDVPYWIDTPEQAREAVRELAEQNVDFVKIWVDDRNGRYEKLTPELYGAVIDEAHAHGLRVTAHIFSLEDAKGLLRAGVDAFAHGIRDQDVDDELIDLWKERPEVVLVPNLPGPGVPVDHSWLSGSLSADAIAELQEGSVERPAAQEAFGIQARNLVRLRDDGITIAFGTDGGNPWSVHQELEDMVRAGLTPGEVIVAATSTSAALMNRPDLGHIAEGKSADFVVLDADPLEDITNTRRIVDVYLRGSRVDRDAIGARLKGSE